MKSLQKEILEWIITLAAAAAIAFIMNLFGGLAIVEGPSMLPTLNDGEFLIRARYIRTEPQMGDIVAFDTSMPHPWKIYRMFGVNKTLVKRVIGLPGDKITISNGEVYLNDKKLEESYIKDGTTDGEISVTVPDGHYFVMGDNRLNSNDSRSGVGFVKREDIIGRVVFRLFPFGRFGSIK